MIVNSEWVEKWNLLWYVSMCCPIPYLDVLKRPWSTFRYGSF